MYDYNATMSQSLLMACLKVKQGSVEESAQGVGLVESYDRVIRLDLFQRAQHRCLIASSRLVVLLVLFVYLW